MSIPAQKWAMEQKVGSASAKFVLVVLATYCDFNGSCWPSQDTLGRDTDQSVDTIQRCLHKLQALGMVYLGPRRVKKNGHASVRQMVVLFDDICVDFAQSIGYDPAEIARKYEIAREKNEDAQDQGLDEKQKPQIAVSVENGLEENQQDGGNANENRGRKLRCQDFPAQKPQIAVSADTALLRCHEQPYSESFPLKSPQDFGAAALAEGSWQADFAVFDGQWPWTPDEASERVRSKFRVLSPEERLAVNAAAKSYLADCASKRVKAMSARRFVVDGVWRSWSRTASRSRDSLASQGKQPFVRQNSPADMAWRSHDGKSKPFCFFSKENNAVGYYRPTLFPPGAAKNAGGEDVGSALAREIDHNSGMAK